MKKIISTSIILCLVLEALPITAQNATINWGLGVQAISGDSDVSTQGTLVNAFNLGTSGVTFATVNGVTFTAFAFPGYASFESSVTVGNYTFNEIGDGGLLNSYNNLGSGTGVYSTLSPSYRSILSSGGSSTLLDTLQLTINGLTVGDTYEFQWWNNNSSLTPSSGDGYQLNTTATAVNSITLDGNDGTAGSVGQFAIGTFTANNTTQNINFDGVVADPSDPMLNAFQLRDIAVAPEPSTYGLLAMGLMGLAVVKLRFKRTPQI